MFNLPNVYIDNACYVSFSSNGVFFSNLFRFNEMDCLNKKGLEMVIFKLLFLSYMPFSYYHKNSIAMLYLGINTKKSLNLQIWI